MKRLVLAVSLMFAVAGVGCEDDDDDRRQPTDAAKEAGGDGGGGMCVGSFAAVNRAGLGARTAPGGMCAASADLDYICTADLAVKGRECATSCASTGSVDPNCVSTCLQRGSNLSAGCASCYRDLIGCSAAMCPTCLTNAAGDACRACQVASCYPRFASCSGLPVVPPGTDGGPAPGDAAVDVPAQTDTGRTDTTPSDVSSSETGGDAGVDAGSTDAADGGADATAG